MLHGHRSDRRDWRTRCARKRVAVALDENKHGIAAKPDCILLMTGVVACLAQEPASDRLLSLTHPSSLLPRAPPGEGTPHSMASDDVPPPVSREPSPTSAGPATSFLDGARAAHHILQAIKDGRDNLLTAGVFSCCAIDTALTGISATHWDFGGHGFIGAKTAVGFAAISALSTHYGLAVGAYVVATNGASSLKNAIMGGAAAAKTRMQAEDEAFRLAVGFRREEVRSATRDPTTAHSGAAATVTTRATPRCRAHARRATEARRTSFARGACVRAAPRRLCRAALRVVLGPARRRHGARVCRQGQARTTRQLARWARDAAAAEPAAGADGREPAREAGAPPPGSRALRRRDAPAARARLVQRARGERDAECGRAVGRQPVAGGTVAGGW
eukprot:5500766-Prymnesium_polylepis.1